MPDGRDHGDAAGEDRARHGLLVEGPEILERAAAARDDDDVDVGDGGEAPQRRRDRERRALALHGRGREEDRHRAAAVRDAHDVADDGARGRRHDAQAARQERQRALAGRVEEALGGELGS